MTEFMYTVRVDASSEAEADQVMAERLDHDEDYGFSYAIDYRFGLNNPWPTVDHSGVLPSHTTKKVD